MSTPTITSSGATGLLVDYPLPWHVVAEPACPRLVAANGATVLAADSDETPILVFIATALNAGHIKEPSLHSAIARPGCCTGRPRSLPDQRRFRRGADHRRRDAHRARQPDRYSARRHRPPTTRRLS